MQNEHPPHVEGAQPRYRAYIIGADGRIVSAFDLPAFSDDEARAEAAKLVDGHDIELWDRGRMIVRLPAKE